MSLKKLREITSAGILDCKKALEVCGNDIEASIKWLKEKGLASALKRSDRETLEGAVAIDSRDGKHAMVFLGSETDFVAKNEKFCTFALKILSNFLEADSKESMLETKIDGELLKDSIAHLGATLGENITLRGTFTAVSEPEKPVFTYLHNKINSDFHQIATVGVIVKIRGECDALLGKHIAMHIAAFKPSALKIEDMGSDWIDNQTKEALNSGEKPSLKIAESILEEQNFLMDGSLKMKDLFAKNQISVEEFKVFAVR